MMRIPALKLRTKIGFYFLVLLTAWSAFLFVGLRELLAWRLDEVFRDRGADLTGAVLAECVPLVTYEDTVGLGEVPARTMKANPEVRYVVVEDEEGNVLTSTFPGGGVPRDLRSLEHDRIPGKEISVRLVSFQDELIHDYVARKGRATVRLGFSLAPARNLVSRITAGLLWLGLAGIVAVIIAAIRISRPIEALTEAIGTRGPSAPAQPIPDGTLETHRIMNRFQELTGELQERNDQLEAARKLAYLGELSAALAHEVNNPLGVVVLNSGLLSRRCESGEIAEEAAREVGMLKLAARRATLAVQGLLQFTRYSTRGARPAAAQSLHVEPMIRETLDLLGDRLRAGECRATLDIAPDLPAVACDVTGVQQVLFNLLLNALDACAAGGNIAVRASVEGEFLALDVVDDGIGMPEEVLRRAKEPFYTTKTEDRGIGLGLAISHSIVAAHGGRLELRSLPGKGTQASVRIPVGRAP